MEEKLACCRRDEISTERYHAGLGDGLCDGVKLSMVQEHVGEIRPSVEFAANARQRSTARNIVIAKQPAKVSPCVRHHIDYILIETDVVRVLYEPHRLLGMGSGKCLDGFRCSVRRSVVGDHELSGRRQLVTDQGSRLENLFPPREGRDTDAQNHDGNTEEARLNLFTAEKKRRRIARDDRS